MPWEFDAMTPARSGFGIVANAAPDCKSGQVKLLVLLVEREALSAAGKMDRMFG